MSPVLLQPRDREILTHVSRYRLTTPEVVHRLFFADRGMEAAKSVLKRLNGSFLRSRPLFGKRRYYQLSPAGAALSGQPDEAAQPLGTNALPARFGVLEYCCLGFPSERPRFTRSEYAESFPELQDLPFADYYLDIHKGVTRLGRIIVELGGDHLRFLRKVREYMTRDTRCRPFAEMVRQDRFVLALVTAEESKRDAIIAAIERQPPAVPVRVECVPDLIQFPRRTYL